MTSEDSRQVAELKYIFTNTKSRENIEPCLKEAINKNVIILKEELLSLRVEPAA